MSKKINRRQFLKVAGMGSVGTGIALSGLTTVGNPISAALAAYAGGGLALNAHQYGTVNAIASRIIPTDDTPGATEANVVNFIDMALADATDYKRSSSLGAYESGIAALDVTSNSSFGADFIDLNASNQDAVLTAVQGGSFFKMVLTDTWEGFCSHPRYGGNKDGIGWDVIGYRYPEVDEAWKNTSCPNPGIVIDYLANTNSY